MSEVGGVENQKTFVNIIFRFPASTGDKYKLVMIRYLHAIRLTRVEILASLDHFLKGTELIQKRSSPDSPDEDLRKDSQFPQMRHIVPDIRTQFEQQSKRLLA